MTAAFPDRWITDWKPSQRFPLYTRANAGEVLPDPGSPLGLTLVWEPGVVLGWRDSMINVGTFDDDEIDQERPEVVGLFGGYLYIDGTAARLFGVRAPGLTPEMIDFVYFGEHPDVPPYTPEPWHENVAASERLAAWMGQVITATDLPELRDDRDEANAVREARPDLTGLTEAELVARARSFTPLIRRLFERHLTVTAGTSIGPGALNAVATAVGDPSLALTLITGVGDIDSAAPSHAMWAMSRKVRAAATTSKLFDEGIPGLVERLRASTAEPVVAFRSAFKRFINEFGSRGPNEWDIRSDTWETKPELALSLIDRMRFAADEDSPEIRNARNVTLRESATERIRAALADDAESAGSFEAGLRSAHVYLAARERAKTNIIKVLHEVRMAVRELAVRTDYSASHVCMLLADELDSFAADPEEFRARLAMREQQYLALFELEPPFILNGTVKPLGEWERKGSGSVIAAEPGEVLTGVPGAPGTATGRARVILDPADPLALEPGDVLVAPITDPAWTPLFVPAAAVVVDVGAQVSHAVIVSRELGIPCVVSVKDATRRIRDGAMISVDGSTGTVTVLSAE